MAKSKKKIASGRFQKPHLGILAITTYTTFLAIRLPLRSLHLWCWRRLNMQASLSWLLMKALCPTQQCSSGRHTGEIAAGRHKGRIRQEHKHHLSLVTYLLQHLKAYPEPTTTTLQTGITYWLRAVRNLGSPIITFPSTSNLCPS